ncbi:ABC transporter substrate-binding protein [Micromonospora yangpuensis]|uniref:Carbohydrate ABC transporter substrate-binding protein, CUT1 family (TC 3.A.1.1.-) n=1 Tax=Micromonospora yangpuensis TaxID=683228 RepID=A0A1C6V8I2_9ACTN|nr:extracellular solute-binding protein [Micromonospora yangpuensis]GGM28345.1 sugar ABC transporter substrate-binding protein [Micromonospora yangpuensis]SCL62586.1 carbohydrate ABC transporter substrate-binding protein, CUT1 family (TC 3.A.1.1.-) [Micromonospora yangpuensis]
MPAARHPLLSPPDADPGRRRLLAAALGLPVLGAGALTGCQADRAAPVREEPVELSIFWWGNQLRAELTERALRLYTARNPQVTFRVTWQANSGYYERLATQAAAGNAPDLLQIDDNFLAEYAQREILLDLSGHVADSRLDLSGLPESLASYAEVGGRTMAVAAAQNTPALAFNRSLLRRLGQPEPQIGMSYQEYLSWADQVTQASGGKVAGTMDPSGDYRPFWLWLRSRNAELYRGRRLGFDADDVVDWFDLWQRARSAKSTPRQALVDRAADGDPSRQLVVTGDSAASFCWSNQLADLQSHTEDEIDLVSCPGPPSAHWARASMYWAAFRGTRHADTAVDVINFLTNNLAVGEALGIERGLSANLGVRRYVQDNLTDEAVKRSAAFEATLASRFGPAPAPPPRGHGKVRRLLTGAAESVQTRRSTIRAAATRFVNEAGAALAE